MVNYFRHLIFQYAERVEPIFKLICKNILFVWTQECQQSFEKLQEVIFHQSAIKNINFENVLYLITDASKVSISGIFLQKSNGNFYPIEFFFKILLPAEGRYPSIGCELRATYASIRHFQECSCDKMFIIFSNAKS